MAALTALAESVVEQRRADARLVTLVAQWADLHPVIDESEADPAWDRFRRATQTKAESYGADGTPAVSEYAATELGLLLQTTTTTAGNLLRDVLDLRHRHPRLHSGVLDCTVELWKARQVVRATARADLSLEQARAVDAQTIRAVTSLPFGRAMTVVEGRAKTFGGFALHQVLPGMYLWRTPTGHWFQVDSRGTHPLGRELPEILRQRRRPPPRRRFDYTEAVADIEIIWDPAA